VSQFCGAHSIGEIFMATEPKALPDIKKFLEDPAHENDRGFFEAIYKHFRAKEIAEETARKEAEATQNENVFDRLFGAGKPK
jgi:hypothetical protein